MTTEDVLPSARSSGEVLSFASFASVAVPSQELARKQRATEAAIERRQARALESDLLRRARLYRKWTLRDAAAAGPDAYATERALLVRNPVPAVIGYGAHGDPFLVQYVRGVDDVLCQFCKKPCEKDGKKFPVVYSPWGIWCLPCASKASQYVGEYGKLQRMRERRRAKARSSSST